ncbi:Protein kinase domain [Trypanosoma melophagium]|uniref:Protein kinase domain n=1 Tax=Trypanosoma melophagium TaxID=715481 RepID=UPI00351A083B|nr:Protein kinase domain [Trypanosoma melophagium]
MTQRFGPYRVGETVGRGTFGKVKLAVHEATRSKVALKVIPRKVMEQNARSNIKITREITILKVLRHPNIMCLYDVVQTKHDIVLVLEYVSGGELFDYICSKGRLDETIARHLFQQVVAGVAYCHRHRVAHRDLKPENIMMEQGSTTIKIGDFGLASVTHDGCFFETSCGTPNYASPEIVSGKPYGGPEADVWSCGVVLYTMVAGALPFDDTNVENLFKKIQTANYIMPSGLSEEVRDLLRRMIVVNPLERATMEQVMQHPWLRPAFPPYLLKLHYEAILDTMRFGKALEFDEETLDDEVIASVANCYRLSFQETASIVAEHEKTKSLLFNPEIFDGNMGERHYPGGQFFTKYANVVDAKLWPTPLVIPAAEQALREEEHDVHVAYLILLRYKQSLLPPEYLSHMDARSEATGSFILTLSMGQGYGSVNANSLQQISMGFASASRTQNPSQKAPQGCIRAQKDGDVTFCGSLPVHVQAESKETKPNTDTYMEGYNKLAEAFLPLYLSQSKHTLLGKFLRVIERPISVLMEQTPTSTPSKLSNNSSKGNKTGGGGGSSSSGNLLQPLLKPMTDDVDMGSSPSVNDSGSLLRPTSTTTSTTSSTSKGGRIRIGVQGKKSTSLREKTIPFSSPNTPDVLHCEIVARFGNDFIRNGVLFSPSDPAATLRCVYSAMKEEGLLWKTIHPYYFSAVMYPSVKLQIKIYKVTEEGQLVDVKVSCQSGMHGIDVACKLLERLRKKSSARVGNAQLNQSQGDGRITNAEKGSTRKLSSGEK